MRRQKHQSLPTRETRPLGQHCVSSYTDLLGILAFDARHAWCDVGERDATTQLIRNVSILCSHLLDYVAHIWVALAHVLEADLLKDGTFNAVSVEVWHNPYWQMATGRSTCLIKENKLAHVQPEERTCALTGTVRTHSLSLLCLYMPHSYCVVHKNLISDAFPSIPLL